MDCLLTPADVARALATDEKTVEKLIRDGSLRAVSLPNGQYRVTPSAFDAFLDGAGAAPSPYLNVPQAAAFLGIAVRTLYNNRKHIPALPGFRTLRFDPKVLEELRASPRFMSRRLAGKRRESRPDARPDAA